MYYRRNNGWYETDLAFDTDGIAQTRDHVAHTSNGWTIYTYGRMPTQADVTPTTQYNYATLRYRGTPVGTNDLGQQEKGCSYRGSPVKWGFRNVPRRRVYYSTGNSACNTGSTAWDDYEWDENNWLLRYLFQSTYRNVDTFRTWYLGRRDTDVNSNRGTYGQFNLFAYNLNVTPRIADDGESEVELVVKAHDSSDGSSATSVHTEYLEHRFYDAFESWSACTTDYMYSGTGTLYALYFNFTMSGRTYYRNGDMMVYEDIGDSNMARYPYWAITRPERRRFGFMVPLQAIDSHANNTVSERNRCLDLAMSRFNSFANSTFTSGRREWNLSSLFDYMFPNWDSADLSHPEKLIMDYYGGIGWYTNNAPEQYATTPPSVRRNAYLYYGKGCTTIPLTAEFSDNATDDVLYMNAGYHQTDKDNQTHRVGLFNYSSCWDWYGWCIYDGWSTSSSSSQGYPETDTNIGYALNRLKKYSTCWYGEYNGYGSVKDYYLPRASDHRPVPASQAIELIISSSCVTSDYLVDAWFDVYVVAGVRAFQPRIEFRFSSEYAQNAIGAGQIPSS